ncbi:MAG: aminopeptidase P family protein [Trueperaceae bacterium]|nr:aminopeptidase P family protein [Trueperaceae bacterium]
MSKMPDTPTLFQDNTKRVAEALRAAGLDAAIIASPVNVLYTSGANIKTQVTIPERLAVHVLETSGRATLIVCDIEEPLARRETWIEDVRNYVEFRRSPIEIVVDVLEERGLTRGRLGFESRFMVEDYMKEMRSSLAKAELVAMDDVLDRVRAIKSDDELALMEYAQRETETLLYEAFADFKVGDSEEQLGWRIKEGMRARGVGQSLLTVVSGKLTAVPHAKSTKNPIGRGDMIKVDVGARFRNYTSDFARCVFVGELPAHKARTYDKYLDIYDGIIAGTGPGMTAADVYNLMADLHAKHDIPLAAPHVGHSIGIGLHDEPLLHPRNDRQILPRMVLALEPRAILEDGERVHLEDMALITTSGCRVFADVSKLREVRVIG